MAIHSFVASFRGKTLPYPIFPFPCLVILPSYTFKYYEFFYNLKNTPKYSLHFAFLFNPSHDIIQNNVESYANIPSLNNAHTPIKRVITILLPQCTQYKHTPSKSHQSARGSFYSLFTKYENKGR